MRLILAVLLLSLTGCATLRDPDVGRNIALAGLAADVGTTLDAVENRGCVEKNPIYGDVSSSEGKARLLGLNALFGLAVWWLGDHVSDGLPLTAIGMLRLGVAGHNATVQC